MPMYNGKEFTEQQMSLILLGSSHGLNINSFAKPFYSPEKMSNIISVLTGRTNRYDGKDYTDEQIALIKAGLEDEFDVDIYADPEYSPEKMEAIMLILVSDCSLEFQDLGKFTLNQLNLILKGIEEGLKVYLYAKPEFTYEQMQEIYYGLKKSVDISGYSNPVYSWEKMRLIRLGEEYNIDVSRYIEKENKLYLYAVGLGIENECDEKYFNPDVYQPEQIMEIALGCKDHINPALYAMSELPYTEMRIRREYIHEHNTLNNYISEYREKFYKGISLKTIENTIKEQADDLDDVTKKYVGGFFELCYLKHTPNPDYDEYMKSVRHFKRIMGLDKLNPVIEFYNYSDEQIDLLFDRFDKGDDISFYAKSEYSLEQMKFISDNSYLIEHLNQVYSIAELNMIKDLYDTGLSDKIQIITNKELSKEHRKILYMDLMDDLDVSNYTDPKISLVKVKLLSLIHHYPYEPEYIINTEYNDEQLKVLIKGLIDRVPITIFVSPAYSAFEMEIIETALSKGISVADYMVDGIFTDESLEKLFDEVASLPTPKPDEPVKKKVRARKRVYARKVGRK